VEFSNTFFFVKMNPVGRKEQKLILRCNRSGFSLPHKIADQDSRGGRKEKPDNTIVKALNNVLPKWTLYDCVPLSTIRNNITGPRGPWYQLHVIRMQIY